MEKLFRRTVAALSLVMILLSASTVEAEIKTYVGIGEYTVMKGETQHFARKQAKLFAERDVLEQVYIYLTSQSSVQNAQLTKDEIIVIAAGRMAVVDTKFFLAKENGAIVVKAKVTAELDPDEIPAAVERERKSRLPDK